MLDQAQRLRKLVQDKNFQRTYDFTENNCKIITVTSGKGGVGKSNFVVNLGITLQKMKKSVLIFDADVGMGNDDVLMGFRPRYNIYDIILKNMDIEEVLTEGPYGIKLLPAGSGLNRIEEISNEQREKFLDKLNLMNGFDFILMDTGAGINRSVLGFINCCDEAIIITTPEPTALTDAYSLMKAISHFKLKSTAKVVVNRVFNAREGNDTFSKFNSAAKRFLNMDLEYLGSINEDRKLLKAVRSQRPFVISYPNCEASKDIHIIAQDLCGSVIKSESGTGIQRMFKKIFSVFS